MSVNQARGKGAAAAKRTRVVQPRAKRMSIEEYAAGYSRGAKCWLCDTVSDEDEKVVVDAVLQAGIPLTAAAGYLRDVCGYSGATENKVSNHIRKLDEHRAKKRMKANVEAATATKSR